MNRRTAGLLAWSVELLCVAMVVASLVLVYLDRASIGRVGWGHLSDLVPPVTVGALGALVASRRPENPIGWMLLGIGTFVGSAGLTAHVAVHGLLAGVSPNGWLRWMGWVQNWIGNVSLGLLVLMLLLFPDGKPPSRRWRWVVGITVVVSLVFTAGAAFDPTPVRLSPHLPSLGNPIGVSSFAGFANSPVFILIVLLLFLALVALLLRLRRSHGEERQQLKWFVFAAGGSVGLLIVAFPLSALSSTISNVAFGAAFNIGFAIGIPAAAALAILRYGLYEIDVVINKTVVYGTLAVFITLVYVGLVVGVGTLVGHRGSPLLSAIAAAVIAVAFQPVRERSRRFANRVVYGKRATPYEVLSDFAERIAGSYSVDEVLPQTARMLVEGTGAVRADVWLLVGSELQAKGSWPTAVTDRIAFGAGDGAIMDVPGATRAVPVRYQGELLGALSIQKTSGDPVTPTEDKLLVDVASQAGLVLRNVRLIEDLRASRQRIVAAQDAAARRLERNIHDGAQQQLVALAVKLNLAGALVGNDPEKERVIIDQLKAEAADALENLRDLARGIYPPLLADQGLVAALRSQARKSAVPVTIEEDGIGRFSQETEAAVYFCTLEALQNVAKYANATTVTVGLSGGVDSLTFSVRDDGDGFDPQAKGYGTGMQGMADRLAALGGELRVTSAPGTGTLIEGRAPIVDRVAAVTVP